MHRSNTAPPCATLRRSRVRSGRRLVLDGADAVHEVGEREGVLRRQLELDLGVLDDAQQELAVDAGLVGLDEDVGGFLGMDTKDVAAPFQAIHTTMKDNKWWLTMNTSKESLKSAPGYRYDKSTTTWVADKS